MRERCIKYWFGEAGVWSLPGPPHLTRDSEHFIHDMREGLLDCTQRGWLARVCFVCVCVVCCVCVVYVH